MGYYVKYHEYSNAYFQIDSNANAKISIDRLDEQITNVHAGMDAFQAIEESVSQAIGMVAGLVSVSAPSGVQIISNYERLNQKVTKLKDEVGECEYSHLTSDFGSIEDMLSNILQIINGQSQKSNVTITAYQAGSISKVPAFQKLQESASKNTIAIESIQKNMLNYKEINSVYWNRTDNYFDEGWVDNKVKFEEALNIIRLETIEQGGLDITSQMKQLGYGKDNYRLQALMKLSEISQVSSGNEITITEVEEKEDWKDKALAYLKDSGEQILSGNYTDKITIGGTVGEVLLGFIGVDLPMDIRDLVYDITHFEASWKWAGSFALDLVALFPVIGMLKYSDETVKIAKRWAKPLGKTVELTADLITSGVKKLKKYLDIASEGAVEAVSSLKNAMKSSADELNQLITRVYSKANGIVEFEFAGIGRLKINEAEIVDDVDDLSKNRYIKWLESKLAEGVDDVTKRGIDSIDDIALKHSSMGDFTYNPKTGEVSKMKGGGHGQSNINFLEKNQIEYNIEKTYNNGVRVGNVPSHKVKAKRTGTTQAWFPESWSEIDIAKAGEYVGNLSTNKSVADGVVVFGEYNGVRVGVIRTEGKISTVFPDATCQP
jgi:uncharacterized protein YebE (UPF0316 family)